MTPEAFEIRPEFQIREDVLAFGFRGGRVPDANAIGLIDKDLLTSVQAAVNGTQPSFVVVDMRKVDFLSSVGQGMLLSLNRMPSQTNWRLVLLGLPMEIQEAFVNANFDRWVALVNDENELRLLIERTPSRPACFPDEAVIDFSQVEINEMLTAGITLDDAIRALERLRG